MGPTPHRFVGVFFFFLVRGLLELDVVILPFWKKRIFLRWMRARMLMMSDVMNESLSLSLNYLLNKLIIKRLDQK